ncbi:MAG: hypothetical protein IH622_13555 [Ochrobactrum anthropi]|uniref:DUF551 domain-containing protein n=1 Tax=Brucella anthropi TaxID=529 RepID=A0A8I0T8Q5_BRUAN|nr:hypothetical protein [Brucella anthropi]MBE0561823.1 hypothetical protein [Brucella anthropi]
MTITVECPNCVDAVDFPSAPMTTLPEEAVKAAHEAYDRVAATNPRLSYSTRVAVKAALTAALPFLSVQGAVKKLEWTKGVVDIASPHPGMKYVACNTTPKGSWAWWLDHAPETRSVFTSEEAAKAAAQADYQARILSALEPSAPDIGKPITAPSAARELALEEAAQAAENAMLEYNLSECAGLADWAAFEVGQESGLVHAAAAIRSLSSPDHADAGKVEGDGWLPIESAPRDGTSILAVCAGVHERTGIPFIPEVVEWTQYGWSNEMWGEQPNHGVYYPTHWRPLPSAPSQEVAGS